MITLIGLGCKKREFFSLQVLIKKVFLINLLY